MILMEPHFISTRLDRFQPSPCLLVRVEREAEQQQQPAAPFARKPNEISAAGHDEPAALRNDVAFHIAHPDRSGRIGGVRRARSPQPVRVEEQGLSEPFAIPTWIGIAGYPVTRQPFTNSGFPRRIIRECSRAGKRFG